MRNTKDLQAPGAARLLEAELIRQIGAIEAKFRELNEEKVTLERMLLKVRQQSEIIKRTEVTRKNSLNRLLIENSIRESLMAAAKAVPTWSLYNDARLIAGQLRPSTFRSILHRMKVRGLVVSPRNGRWELPVAEPNSAVPQA